MHGYQRRSLGSVGAPALAPRTVRALAALVDSIVAALFPTLGIVGLVLAGTGGFVHYLATATRSGARSSIDAVQAGAIGITGAAIVIGALVGFAVVTIYQWYLLASRGQTIGKRLFCIQIVDDRGEPAGFIQALLLRTWVFTALVIAAEHILGRYVAGIGLLIAGLNVMPVFGRHRRCLHDFLASTQVRWSGRSPAVAIPALVVLTVVIGGVGFAVSRSGIIPGLHAAFAAAPARNDATPPNPEPPRATEPVGATPVEVSRPSSGEPAPPPEPVPARAVYRFADDDGVVHFTDDPETIPEKLRSRAQRLP